jgi:hypothetical protein
VMSSLSIKIGAHSVASGKEVRFGHAGRIRTPSADIGASPIAYIPLKSALFKFNCYHVACITTTKRSMISIYEEMRRMVGLYNVTVTQP